jgi:hypothetical protein
MRRDAMLHSVPLVGGGRDHAYAGHSIVGSVVRAGYRFMR